MQDCITSAHVSTVLPIIFFNVKIPPETFYRKFVFTIGILNQRSEHLSKIITLESGSATLIRMLDKRCGAGRQEHCMNILINIRRALGECSGALSKRRRILKVTGTVSQ
jgi:hypothetical protein